MPVKSARKKPSPKTAHATPRPRPAPDGQIRERVVYRVRASRPEAHLFTVECEIAKPNPAGERLALPAWIPGSYLIRDFARHVVSFSALADGKVAFVEKTCKDEWRVVPPGPCQTLTARIEVYAWDLSVRGAHLDTRHAFFNGTSLFLRVVGREHQACAVELSRPEGEAYASWRVATALPRAGSTGRGEFGSYQAAHYEELIDHPVEMGDFDLIEFTAGGVAHDFALSGATRTDPERLAADLAAICAWQLRFWGGPAPMARYVFLGTAVGDGYGGLEHRASTALLFKRDDLPPPATLPGKSRTKASAGKPSPSEGYRGLLGLVAHEYFHTWLVKRIRPVEFCGEGRPDLQRENPTPMLWLFEGFTSYYDDLTLRRCGLIDDEAYLACLNKTLNQVYSAPGRFRQTLAEASFDAWTKFYRPDENTPNSTVSYYAKGALVALAIDLTLRRHGGAGLDPVMRALWEEHGQTGIGVGEDDLRRLVAEQNPAMPDGELDALFSTALHATDDLPLAELLASHGVDLTFPDAGAPSLGVKIDGKNGEAKIAVCYEGGAAQAAGLSAHDTLVAINGLRVDADKVDALMARCRVGEHLEIFAFRRDELLRFDLTVGAAAASSCRLAFTAKAKKTTRKLREAWLKTDAPQ